MNNQTLTSQWPLPPEGIRFLYPQFLEQTLATDPLCRDLYPIAAGFYPHAADHRMTRQQHDSHLLIYCTRGKGRLSLADEEFTVSAGQIVSLPASMAHHYHADSHTPWSIYWVHYRGTLASEYSNFTQPFCPVVTIGIQLRLLEDLQALCVQQTESYSIKAYIHSACLLKQVLSLIALSAERHRPQPGRLIDLEYIQKIMQQHIYTELDLGALATSANLSKYHFARKFKQLTGRSPIQFFIQLKMQHACRLLDTTSDSIKQVAAATGYTDPYYFSRLFKQSTGLSPSAYRQGYLA
tara:strand:+ start:2659 stop:3543 length:885 start_codon:yes stop_codon:yes gene_type:complete